MRYAIAMIAGLAGSLHCLGMCGGFACALGCDARGRVATVQRHLLYNLGRVVSYCFVGAFVGELGVRLIGTGELRAPALVAQRLLAIGSGALIVFFGLQLFGLFRVPRGRFGHAADLFARSLRALLAAPGRAAPLAAGVLNGFLPCPLVYAFVAQAAACGSAVRGLLTMAAFGLGTFPMMAGVGILGAAWRRRAATESAVSAPTQWAHIDLRGARSARTISWRLYGVRVAGAGIVLLGLITAARGLLPLSQHIHV